MMHTNDDDDTLVDIAGVCTMTGGLSRDTIARRVKAGEFPAPVPIALNRHGRAVRVAWRRGDVLQWCREQVQRHRAPAVEAEPEPEPKGRRRGAA